MVSLQYLKSCKRQNIMNSHKININKKHIGGMIKRIIKMVIKTVYLVRKNRKGIEHHK